MFVIKDMLSGEYLLTTKAVSADPKDIELAKRYKTKMVLKKQENIIK